jgi:hypothetical protein
MDCRIKSGNDGSHALALRQLRHAGVPQLSPAHDIIVRGDGSLRLECFPAAVEFDDVVGRAAGGFRLGEGGGGGECDRGQRRAGCPEDHVGCSKSIPASLPVGREVACRIPVA